MDTADYKPVGTLDRGTGLLNHLIFATAAVGILMDSTSLRHVCQKDVSKSGQRIKMYRERCINVKAILLW